MSAIKAFGPEGRPTEFLHLFPEGQEDNLVADQPLVLNLCGTYVLPLQKKVDRAKTKKKD